MTPRQILELQHNDTAIDQLRHRMPRLPEVVASAAAAAEVTVWEQRRGALQNLVADFDAAITRSEHANEVIAAKRDRLEKQLKTIISPREAEALMHEISTLNIQRSALDDEELEAMDGMAQAEAELVEHGAAEGRWRDAAAAAAATAAEATAVAEAELAERLKTREALRADIDAEFLRQYDSMRLAHNGIAVAELLGMRCEGCNLDMSRGEVDNMKRLPPDEMPECPNCGRLLVL
jgi:predicted  nucleic acid-binding Zn-ribbon protein